MRTRLGQFAVPAYLLLCLLLGGSVRSAWPNAAVQLGAVALILIATFSPRPEPVSKRARWLIWIVCAALALLAIQLVPLPPGVWTNLPGRAILVRGYEMLGEPLPYLPLSLAPYATLASALALLPPLAVLVGMLRMDQDERLLLAAVVAGAVANVMVAALQVSGGRPSIWYVYDISNNGAVGLFANTNHLGTLLVVAIAFAAAFVSSQWSRSRAGTARGVTLLAGVGAFSIIVAGLALNRSLAALALTAPVALLSAFFLAPAGTRLRSIAVAAGAGVLLLLAGAVALSGSPLSEKLAGRDVSSFATRAEFWTNTGTLIADNFPVGTGFGSFETVYPLVEDPHSVDRFYVNHAHNDFLEIILEGGLPGLVLLVVFLGWWLRTAAKAWKAPASRAAAIASGAMLAHSFVDYPLRTAALAAVFATCLGLMLRKPAAPAGGGPMSRPARHVRIA